jgi:hypothetical protein
MFFGKGEALAFFLANLSGNEVTIKNIFEEMKFMYPQQKRIPPHWHPTSMPLMLRFHPSLPPGQVLYHISS